MLVHKASTFICFFGSGQVWFASRSIAEFKALNESLLAEVEEQRKVRRRLQISSPYNIKHGGLGLSGMAGKLMNRRSISLANRTRGKPIAKKKEELEPETEQKVRARASFLFVGYFVAQAQLLTMQR